jgi:hypothetical protein
LLHDEWIEFLKRKNISKNIDYFKTYYMQRKLKRIIQIDKIMLETKKDDKEKEQKTDDFIIVHSEEEFKKECSQNPQMKSVHFLIQDKINQNQFKWQKSDGAISNLRK